jgi:hypothetical protein
LIGMNDNPPAAEAETDRVGSIENGVLFGSDQTLFLADGGHKVLDYCLGRLAPSADSIANFLKNIGDRARQSAAIDANYAHLISPDKQSVLLGNFPFPEPIRLGELYLAQAGELSGRLVYPVRQLMESPRQTYQKTDTHMTDAGTIISAEAALATLTGSPQTQFADDLNARVTGLERWVGDLGSKLEPQRSEIRQTLKGGPRTIWLHNDLVGGNNGIIDIIFNPSRPPDRRLLIFGDSFGRDLARVLSHAFFQTVFLRSPYFYPDIVSAVRPTDIISQNVERYLTDCVLDEARPSFFMHPHLSGLDYRPSKTFAEAFSAVLSFGRPPYSRFLDSLNLQEASG